VPRTPKNQNLEQNSQEKSLTDIVYPESTGIPVPEYLGTPDKLPESTEDAPQPKRRGRKPGSKAKSHKEVEANIQPEIEPPFQEKKEPVDGIAAAEKRLAEQYGVSNIDAIAEPIFTGEQNYKPVEPTEDATFTGESSGDTVVPQSTEVAQVQGEGQADPNAPQQGDVQAQNGEGIPIPRPLLPEEPEISDIRCPNQLTNAQNNLLGTSFPRSSNVLSAS
jgi:transcription termination factor Rho